METTVRVWHASSAEETARNLQTDLEQGLTLQEAGDRQKTYGLNVLTPRKRQGLIIKFLLQFHNPMLYILLGSAIVAAFFQKWVDAGVIFGVLLANAMIGFLQENRAEKAIEALRRSIKTDAAVLRDGLVRRLPSQEIVPGDVIFLQAGDKVPADLRLTQAREMKINESMLTGESLPVEKHDEIFTPETVLADRRNMAYSGTLVTNGQGQGIAVGTGNQTETGKISSLIEETDKLETPLTRKIAGFSRLLLVIIMGMAVLTFLVGILRRQPVFDMFMAAVALAVGAIPEGLPAAITITLAIGVARMAQQRAVIRKLPAVETLGSTTVICSDKTGTLTENQMTVQQVLTISGHFQVSGTGFSPAGSILRSGQPIAPGDFKDLDECLAAGLLCNDARLLKDEQGRWKVEGDPTEGALIASAAKGEVKEQETRERLVRTDVVPFESEFQYMATLHQDQPNSRAVIYAKGSVEALLDRCQEGLGEKGETLPLTKELIMSMAEGLAAQGLRVLALARRALPKEHTELNRRDLQGMTFLGLQAMIDPPRQEVMAAIRACHSAGIDVKMITGDHVLTAKAIAAKLGLQAGPGPVAAVSGQELARYGDQELAAVAAKTTVFARVAPEQKLNLVHALQAQGQVVAMTGDGVNDAPALKAADIGIAMGMTGTEVAKEAADMVLTDDNFASIEAAVEEGRGVYDNLTKFIIWTLPTNMGEGLIILAAIFAGAMLPLLPVQALWINMSTAVLLGLMLAFEPKERGIMNRPPRDPKTPLLTKGLIWRIFLVSVLMLAAAFGLFQWKINTGRSLDEARTLVVNVIVFVELFYLFNCRSLTLPMFQLGVFSNPWVWYGVLAMTGVQWLFTYLPVMNLFFHSAPLPWQDWGLLLLAGLAVYALIEIEKGLVRMRNNAKMKAGDRPQVGR